MAQVRLQKILSAAGIDSRRNCEQLILDGQVRVNGRVVDTLPAFADPDSDQITVHGRRIGPVQRVYYLLNKPKGVICTNSDPQGRRKAIDLVPSRQRIFCVGRLDIESSGLIILTNDNELTNRLTHPRYELTKTYRVDVTGLLTGEAVEKLKKGVWLSEGRTGRAAVKILRRGRNVSTLEIVIREGLNRQVRRMLARVGLGVKSLTRTKIGKIDLHGVGVGKYRELTASEAAYLKKVTGL
jgi:23S rRNA pseudouridine2605 synthase